MVSRRTKALYRLFRYTSPLAMAPIIARQHRAEDALTWLAIVSASPVLGIPLYFLFGEFSLRREVRGHTRVRRSIEEDRERWERQIDVPPPGIDGHSEDMVRLAEGLTTRRHGGLPIVGGNRVELLSDSTGIVERIIEDIDEAQHHVHLLFYIFNDDDTGWKVAEALARAAGRGVECRLLVDGYGSDKEADPSFFDRMSTWLRKRGVATQEMLPVRPSRRPLARFDLRNHRKLVVIDGVCGYIGSLNIHDPDFQLDTGVWRQMMVRVLGPGVTQLQLLFLEDWYFATDELLGGEQIFPPADPVGEAAVQTVPGGPTYGRDLLQNHLVGVIHDAERQLTITTPYFVPDEAMLVALGVASLKGVDVNVIIPRWSDQRLADLAARGYFEPLLAAGVKIYLLAGDMLHAKSMSVDDRMAVVGSANYDRRSLFLNYEANLVIYDETFARTLRSEQEAMLHQSQRLDPGWWKHQPAFARTIYSTAKLASSVL